MTSRRTFRRIEPEARRQSLLEACARVLARSGPLGTSVRAVAREAEVSPGLVGHYFASAEAMIDETFADVEARVTRALDEAVEAAGNDPRARLEAYVTASFQPPVASAEVLATWTTFWIMVRTSPAIAARHDRQYATFRERMEGLLEECGIRTDARSDLAIAITAMIDGLWLELCLAPQVLTASIAARVASSSLDALLGRASGRDETR